MASLNDVFTELQQVNSGVQTLHTDLQQVSTELQTVHNDVGAVNATLVKGFADTVNTLNAGFTTMSQGLQGIISLQVFANQLLEYHTKQNDTIICVLEHISENTCDLVNQAHLQTASQTSIRDSAATVAQLLKTVHADAALELERLEKLRQQIEACCPPPRPEPVCTYEPCEKSEFRGEPPQPSVPEFKPVAQPEHG